SAIFAVLPLFSSSRLVTSMPSKFIDCAWTLAVPANNRTMTHATRTIRLPTSPACFINPVLAREHAFSTHRSFTSSVLGRDGDGRLVGFPVFNSHAAAQHLAAGQVPRVPDLMYRASPVAAPHMSLSWHFSAVP